MIIAYASDLHLEFGYSGVLNTILSTYADVLVLAGDITTASVWKNIRNPESKQGLLFKQFLSSISKNFNKVFIVLGNHDHYGGVYQHTLEYAKAGIKFLDNVHILDNSTVTYDGVLFAGTTMWTEMANNNPMIRLQIHQGMNDFKKIKYKKGNNYAKFTPYNAYDEFLKASQFIRSLPKNEKCVIITHHAPSYESVPSIYKTDKMNDAYYSRHIEQRLHEGEYDPILWIHGHIHNKTSYFINKTLVTCNTRGYHGYESLADNFKLELEVI